MPPQLAPGQSHTGNVPLVFSGAAADSKGVVQIAIKNNVKVFYFQDTMDISCFLTADGRLERPTFLEQWKGITAEHRTELQGLPPQSENVETICPKLEASHIFFIARRKLPDGQDLVYFSVKTHNNVAMLAEVGFRPGSGTASVAIKAGQTMYVPLLSESIAKTLRS